MTREYTEITTPDDITPEILDAAREVADCWNGHPPVNTEFLLGGIEAWPLADGSHPQFGDDTASPAVKAILGHAENWMERNA